MMHLIWLFLVSIVPGIFWVWYFYRQDHLDPEPWPLVAISFMMGIFAVIPVSIIETPFANELERPDSLFRLFLVLIFVVGLPEELFKFLAAYISVYRNREFNEVMDGIVYVVTAALGFAAAENLLYAAAFGIKVGAIRAIVTSLAHAGFSGIVGFYFGMARCNPKRSKYYLTIGLTIGILLHGIYDFFVITKIFNFFVTIGVVLALQLYLARLIKRAEHLSPFK